MYEKFPYPSRRQGELFDSHPRLCLSYRAGNRFKERLSVLDAGCGTGDCSFGTALYNRDCQVTAADFNRPALERIREEAASLALTNLTVCETDLNTLEGLEVPAAGFDVIVCGGVIHHLADPERGLSNLVGALAPNGVMRLMVYNTLGRQSLTRYVKALRLLHTDSDKPEHRLGLARSLFASVAGGPLRQAPWGDGGEIDDIEFVDRYLHPNETSYSVAEYLELLDRAGLVFLRWHEPAYWDLAAYVQDAGVLEELRRLPEVIQYQLVEHLSNQVMLDAYVAHKGSALAEHSELPQDLIIGLNPQVVLQVCQQIHGGLSSEVSPRAYLRGRPSIPLQEQDFQLLRRLTRGPVAVRGLVSGLEERLRLVRLLESDLVFALLPSA